MDTPQRVLIIDDVAETRVWIGGIVDSVFPGALSASAGSVAEALVQLDSTVFDIALVDLGLPDGSGLEVLQHARCMTPSPVCVVTTVFDDDRHLFSALREGALGYLLKDRPPEELASALAGILADQPPLSPAIARRVLAHFVPHQAMSTSPLSPREREVLLLVAKGYTVAETATSLGLKASTVAGYVKQIYRKLEVGSRAEAALEAQRQGLL